MATNNRGGNRGNRSNNRGRNNNPEGRNQYSGGVMDMARERPMTAALGAAAAVGAGVFLWSRRNQISDQISNLSDQIGEWREGFGASGSEEWDDTAGLTSTGSTGSSNNMGTASRNRRTSGMSETGGGNSSLGASSGGSGTTGSASGRGRARSNATS